MNTLNNKLRKFQKKWAELRKRKWKRETEPLLIDAQNNATRTNYVKAKIDNMCENKCIVCNEKQSRIEMKQ